MARVKRNDATATKFVKPGGKIKSSNPLPIQVFQKQIGRKPLYKPEYDEFAKRAFLLGLEDGEVADLIGVSLATLLGWVNKHPSFLEARAYGKVVADLEIADSMRQRALGYTHKAEKIMLGPNAQVIRAEYTQHYPPDTKAGELWLYNRHSKRWRNRQTVENEGEVGLKIKITGGLPTDDEPEEE